MKKGVIMTGQERNLNMLSRKFYKMCNEFNCTLQGVSINSLVDGFESFIVSMKVNDNEFNVLVTFDELKNEWLYTNTNKHTISNNGIEKKTIIGFCRYIVIDIINFNKTIEENKEATEDYNEYEEILDSTETGEETTNTTGEGKNNELKGHLYIDTDSVKIAPFNPTPEICHICGADRQGNRCGGVKFCTVTRNRYYAMVKPEWHNVSLATLANLDFDMLDEKRQRYFTVYRELQETLTRLRKCKTLESYDKCLTRLMRRKNVMWARGEISNAMWHFIEVKLSMQNVESGIWGSYNEKSTGYHKSRRYNKSRA